MTIDSHIHFYMIANPQELVDALDMTGCAYGNLVATNSNYIASHTIDNLYAKHYTKGRFYCYGALDSTLYYDRRNMGERMVEHVKDLMECGCDGIKMLEGKPSARKRLPIPDFDDPLFEPYWDYMEKNLIPIVWHVNDPEEFWSDELVPDWARRSGWYYGEGDWVNNEDQYRQIDNVLKRHPNLQITFAHFYFLSAQLDRLSKIMDSCPNVGVDITPGIELFTNLSKNIEEARKFFIKYQDRIYYGTDIARDEEEDLEYEIEDSKIRGKLCHDFLMKDKVFIKGDERSLLGKDDLDINGLALEKDVYEKILSGNFIRVNGDKPKEVDVKKVLIEIEKEKNRNRFLAKKQGKEPDLHILDFCEDYFKKQL